MRKRTRFFYLFLVFFNLFAIAIIIFLGLKIKDKFKGKVKGAQYATVIKKENLTFESENKQLKYFYEPKANNIELATAEWLGYETKYTVNADSLNERSNYPIEKKRDVFRIITIGDSFTFGQYANTKDNYPEKLEDLLNSQSKCKDISRFEVINLGVMGYDTEYTVERFLKRGIKYHPDLVIWLINSYNLEVIREEMIPVANEIGEKEEAPDFDLKKGWVKYDRAYEELKQKWGNGYLEKHNKEIFLKLNNVYKGKLLVISLAPFNDQNKSLIINFISLDENYKYYDELLKNYWENETYKLPDSHPTQQGYKKIAENLYEYLSKEHLIPCN